MMKYYCILEKSISPYGIFSKVLLCNPDIKKQVSSLALAKWDTGAMVSAISRDMFNRLQLELGKRVVIKELSGVSQGNVSKALISICVEGRFIRIPVIVTNSILGAGGMNPDLIIGLDFISKGSFSISGYENGKPIFVFCYPALPPVDYSDLLVNAHLDFATGEYE